MQTPLMKRTNKHQEELSKHQTNGASVMPHVIGPTEPFVQHLKTRAPKHVQI